MDTGSIEHFAKRVADLLTEATELIGELPVRDDSRDSRWAEDRRDWSRLYGDAQRVDSSLSGPAAIYLYEAGALVTTVANLLRTGDVAATLDPLVRAAVERAGRINWLLDTEVNASQRAARAALERAVCLAHYLESAARIGGPDPSRKEFRASLADHVEWIERWFTPTRPRKPPPDGTLPGWYVARWTVDEESYPRLSEMVYWACGRGMAQDLAGGVYGDLSGFSHPNFVFSRSHFGSDATGNVIFDYGEDSVAKIARLAQVSFGNTLTHFAWYFGLGQERIFGRLKDLAERLDALCSDMLLAN